MAWANIFDLGDWDLYVQFLGVTSFPSPDSRNYLVPVAQLDPSVGTVTVEDGVIVCNMEAASESGGTLIQIIAVPAGEAPDSAPFRVTATQDGSAMVVSAAGADLQSIASVQIAGGANEYSATVGAVNDAVPVSTELTEFQASLSCPSGQGIGLAYYAIGA